MEDKHTIWSNIFFGSFEQNLITEMDTSQDYLAVK